MLAYAVTQNHDNGDPFVIAVFTNEFDATDWAEWLRSRPGQRRSFAVLPWQIDYENFKLENQK